MAVRVAGTCVWCAGPLTGRQQRWCGRSCIRAHLINHTWSGAREEAIRRAMIPLEERTLRDGDVVPEGPVYCDDCGRRIRGRAEVNHVLPRWGAGYGPGCHHHQTNLQVLAHPCHVAETLRQKRERILVGIPGERPHNIWRRRWTWAAAELYIRTGQRP